MELKRKAMLKKYHNKKLFYILRPQCAADAKFARKTLKKKKVSLFINDR